MKTKYQLLKDNYDIIFQFIKNGILSYQLIRDLEIFEAFQELEKEIKNNDLRFALIGERYELSAKRIGQIVYNLQKEIV
jgi:hypothetical protein